MEDIFFGIFCHFCLLVLDVIVSKTNKQQMAKKLLQNKTNTLSQSVFHNKQYPIIGTLSLEQLLSSFILDCRFKNGQLISLLVQIRTANDVNYTLGPRTALNVSDSEDIRSYLATLHDFFNRLDTHYKSVSSVAVNFNYSLLTKDRYTIMKSRTEANKVNILKEENITMVNNLPLNFHYNSWGTLIESISYSPYPKPKGWGENN